MKSRLVEKEIKHYKNYKISFDNFSDKSLTKRE